MYVNEIYFLINILFNVINDYVLGEIMYICF